MSLGSFIKSAGKGAVKVGTTFSNVINDPGNAVRNVATGGGRDITPGFSARNVISTQVGKLSAAPKSNTVNHSSGATQGNSANTGSVGSNTIARSAGSGGVTSTGGSGIANMLQQIIDSQGQIANNGSSSFATTADTYQGQATNLLNSALQGQRSINNQITSAQQAKQQSLRALLNTVAQHNQSNLVNLGSTGALNSSAANVLARAESNYANGQRSNIGQQEQAALEQARQDQDALNTQVSSGQQALRVTRNNAVQQIGNDIANQLMQLDYQANQVGLSGKVQIDALKNQIVNDGVNKLNEIDSWLQSQLSGNQPISVEDAARNAYNQLQQGNTNVANTFTYDTGYDPSSGLGGNGALSGASGTDPSNQPGAATTLLPVFLRNRNDQTQAA